MSRKSFFPPVSIDDALIIATTIWQHNGGNPMRRVTIFDTLNRQPESSASRSLITASAGFGLCEGNYKSDVIKLTDLGLAIVSRQDAEAKLKAALGVEIIRLFCERYKDATIPNQAAALDFLKSTGIPEQSAPNCLELILTTGRQVGLIQEISGKERIIGSDHALELLKKRSSIAKRDDMTPSNAISQATPTPTVELPRESLVTQAPARLAEVPSLHIDVQIHISADAKPEQIEQVFASMAKHLYHRGE